MKLSAIALAVALGTALSSRGQGDRWVQLGQTKPSLVSTSAYMPGSTSRGAYCVLQFRGEGPALSILHMSVHFGNGQTVQINKPLTININSVSPSINLPGPRRSIRGIDFIYAKPAFGAAPPTLTLYGDASIIADPCPQAP